MLLGEPPRTQFDLSFSMLGFPIRVAPFFWLAAVLLGWGMTQNTWAQILLGSGPGGSGMNPNLLCIWVAAVFLSILIHELGHAFAFRYYGIQSHVVLYHFGGLAIPDAYGGSFMGGRSRNSYSQIVISLAGPLAQIGAAVLLIALIAASGHQAPMPDFMSYVLPIPDAPLLDQGVFLAFSFFFLCVSIFWALLNMLPVYPLDGGQVSRELLQLYSPGDGVRQSLVLSVFAAGCVAALAILVMKDLYLFMMFGMLGYSSFQTLKAYGGGFGGRW